MYGRISVNLIAIHSFNCNIHLSLANQFSLIFLFFFFSSPPVFRVLLAGWRSNGVRVCT